MRTPIDIQPTVEFLDTADNLELWLTGQYGRIEGWDRFDELYLTRFQCRQASSAFRDDLKTHGFV